MILGVIDVILPVLDEAAALPHVLGGLPPGFRPLVVDNGSTDGSAEVARQLGAEVVEEPRRGFGAACFTGLLAATAEVVCFMDADASFSGDDLPVVAGPVVDGQADLVLGRRTPEAGAWPRHARVANVVLAAGLRRWSGVAVHDLGPLRAARRTALLGLGIRDRRFGWPLEMVMRAADAAWRIREVPVAYAPRIGRSKVTGTVRGTLRATQDMAAVARSLR
jgi:glycosyltransferase involved in cell wall biosynthesis